MSEERRPMKRAVALRYQSGKDKAPVLVAKGKGHVAERIIELARASGVPIREDRNLVQVLSTLDLDKQIPPEAFSAVATILAFLYKVNRRG